MVGAVLNRRYIVLGEEGRRPGYFPDTLELAKEIAYRVFRAQVDNNEYLVVENYEGIFTRRVQQSYLERIEKLSKQEMDEFCINLEERLKLIE